MAEKTSEKKNNQQKNKNGKLQEKKKKKKNPININSKNPQLKTTVNDYYAESLKKKKNKKNSKTNNMSNNHKNDFNKSSKKKSGSSKTSLFWLLFTQIAIVTLVLGFIYIVDFEKFVRIRESTSFYMNKAISFLPPVIVVKGRETFKYIQPVMEITINKINVLVNETSTFFNTNPLVKDHWTNIKEISFICSARLVDYMRTLYLQTSQYCNDFQSKLFQ